MISATSSPGSIQNHEIKDATEVIAVANIKKGASKISADFVTHFMKERDYPNWYRGLSFCQMNSADSLLKNIRDDSEQNTTHRVREALQRLGIHPLVSPKRIKLAMRLSQGNDIAFLWFLMELYYSGASHKKGEYSLNEQIVMTAIAHLDAIPTLRELDRLLPKQPNKPKIIKKKGPKKKYVHILPYFEKQKRYKRVTADLKHRVEETQEEPQITKPVLEARNICNPSCVQRNGKVSFELIGSYSTKSLHSKPSVTEEERNLDFGHSDLRHTAHIYFQAPTHHTPYKFNYAEIFEQGSRDLIKESAHYSLGGYCRDVSVDHAECIRKVCKELWNSSVEECRIEQSRKTKELLNEAKNIKDGLDCKMAYYDPNDQDLMTKMLQDAIKEMRNSKKYVLVTFPDAHKTPFLKEFIKKRYGFVYTRDSKRRSFKQSKEVFHVLNRTEIRAKLPTSNDVATKRVVSYACNDYIRKKTNYLKERYIRNFKLSLMENTRNYWGAVRPYQCSNGPPRNEFFAYLPSRENDIHMFRPWKVDEYIRAKNEWDKRQRIKGTEFFA